MFKLAPEASATGTCLQAEVMVAPSKLIEMFGEPLETDDYKVSMRYVFTDEDGNVTTLYDWQATRLYGSGHGPHPTTFRKLKKPHDFHIGGHSGEVAGRFRKWLQSQL